jgi:hypothetical protein
MRFKLGTQETSETAITVQRIIVYPFRVLR